MASETIIEVRVQRHVITSERPISDVIDGIYSGISRPDIGVLLGKLETSGSYDQFSSLVREAQGSAGLMRFMELDLGVGLGLDTQSPGEAGRLVRLIAGNPVTLEEMARHVPDAGSYAPITILIQELPGKGSRVAYDSMVSALAPYHSAAASQVAERLDAEVLTLLRQVT
jgi:uncharacterized protein (DUF302 family)